MRLLALSALVAPALAVPAPSQTPVELTSELVRVQGQARYAGTYHLQAGTWTRGRTSESSSRGLTDSLYSNTVQTGYSNTAIGPTGGAAGGLLIDEGRIPSLEAPNPFALGGAGRNVSEVLGVTVGYCDFDTNAAVSGWTLDFYSSYSPCTFPPDPAQFAGSAVLTGAPSNGCWFIDINLAGSTFLLAHDGDGSFDPTGVTPNTFGVTWRYTGSGAGDAGVFTAGDPLSTDTGFAAGGAPTGSNTYYGEVGLCPGIGSGFGNNDFYWIEDSNGVGGLPAGSNCYFFGGYSNNNPNCGTIPQTPLGGYFLEISGRDPIAAGAVSQAGCIGATSAVSGLDAKIEVLGDVSSMADTVRLRAFDLPANVLALFATGRAAVPAMTVLGGNGWLCIEPSSMGGVGRLDRTARLKNTGPTGVMTLDTLFGEWTTSDVPTATGSYPAMTGLTTHFQAWYQETGVGLGFNFTGSCSVTWQ